MGKRGSVVRATVVLVGLTGLVACDATLASRDDVFSHGADHLVLCAENIDDVYGVGVPEIADALDRAEADGATLHLYTHTPGKTVAMTKIEGVLAAVADRHMQFATYDDLNAGEVPGSLALSFDDHAVAAWTAMRPVLDHYGARVTFFISTFLTLTDDERAQVQQLADDGHDIEYHSTNHFDAVSYSMTVGMNTYLDDDIFPALDAMHAAGYATPIFAYPHGARDDDTDAALSQYFAHLRAIRTTCPW
jgi:hypothetical protein